MARTTYKLDKSNRFQENLRKQVILAQLFWVHLPVITLNHFQKSSKGGLCVAYISNGAAML